MQRKLSVTEYCYGEEEQEVGVLMDDGDEADDHFDSENFVRNGLRASGSQFPKRKPKPPRLTKNHTMKVPPQMTLDIPW